MHTQFDNTEPQNVVKNGPKYILDIEGREIPWQSPTISTEEIASLGGWGVNDGVIEIDRDNNERTLAPGETIELKPGQGFAKKVKWKRGDSLYDLRLQEELATLRAHFGDVEFSRGWFLVARFPVDSRWGRTDVSVAFEAPVGYPGSPPYGFYVPRGLRYDGSVPNNYQDSVSNRPPFDGEWGMFSWTHDGSWRPAPDVHSGTNLLNFALGIAQRFREGV